MDENSDDRLEGLDADRIEEDWERALDAASEAVSSASRARLLTPSFAAHEAELIRAERNWLADLRPTLRKLLAPTTLQG